MRWQTLAVLGLTVLSLAGCVAGDDAAPEPPQDPDEGEPTAPAADPSAAVPPPAPTMRDTPFALSGETPASFGFCGVPDPVGPCVSHVIDEGDYILDVPHEGNVTALTFTMSFDPVTPFVAELFHMLHVDDGTTNTMVSSGPLADGDEVTLDGLVVNATAAITFFAWPVGHDGPVGRHWFDPVVQPFEVDGVLQEFETSA